MIQFYESQLDKIQDLIIRGQVQLDKETTKDILATIRQIKSQVVLDLDKREVFVEKHHEVDTLTRLIHIIKEGEEEATTTGIYEVDTCWRWRQGETNIWTGYANDGKSAFINYLTLIRCIREENSKAAIFSPENYPKEYFYLDFIHTMLGRKPKDTDEEKVKELYDWLSKNIFFVFPAGDFTLQNIHDEFAFLAETEGVNIAIVDPYLKVKHDYGNLAEHHYVAQYMTQVERFAREYNLSYHIVAHQRTPQVNQQTNQYIAPDAYGIKGGGSFMDGVDNLLTLFRPFKKEDYTSPIVEFQSQKIKKQKLVARPNKIQLQFDFHKQRYLSMQGTDLFELAINSETPF